MQRLAQRTAVVTGASSGIGAATARALAGAGAQLVLVARRRERLEALAAELPQARWIAADVRNAAELAEVLADVRCDLLVANAGMALGVEHLPAGDPEEWSVVLDTNVKGVLNTLHAVVPGMARRGKGDVVLLGSVAGRQVYPGGNVYCASKWAVRALYESLRVDMKDSGLRFTTVDPGLVETEFSLVRHKGDRERAGATYAGFEPLRPEDIADAILWAVTRPAHVNVGEIVLWPSAQSSTTHVRRAGAKA